MYVNPKITWKSEKQVAGWEGCGSVAFAKLFGVVKRSESVIVEASDSKGDHFSLKAKGLLARVIQHEFDHLEGTLFVDSSNPKTFMSENEYRKKFVKK